MALYAWQSLNLLQVFDVLREAPLCRLAVADAQGQPWCVPMRFQLEVCGERTVIHLVSPDEGRKLAAVEANNQVCLEFEREGCAWTDTVILTGRAAVGAYVPGKAVEWRVEAVGLSGRRYYSLNEEAADLS